MTIKCLICEIDKEENQFPLRDNICKNCSEKVAPFNNVFALSELSNTNNAKISDNKYEYIIDIDRLLRPFDQIIFPMKSKISFIDFKSSSFKIKIIKPQGSDNYFTLSHHLEEDHAVFIINEKFTLNKADEMKIIADKPIGDPKTRFSDVYYRRLLV